MYAHMHITRSQKATDGENEKGAINSDRRRRRTTSRRRFVSSMPVRKDRDKERHRRPMPRHSRNRWSFRQSRKE